MGIMQEWEWAVYVSVTPERIQWEQKRNEVLSNPGLKGNWSNQLVFISMQKWKQPVSLPFLPQLASHQGLNWEKLSLYRAQYVSWTTQDEVFETLSLGTDDFHFGR